GDEYLVEGRGAGQSGAQAWRPTASDQDVTAISACNAAHQLVSPRWHRADRSLHDISCRRQSLLLPDRHAGEGRTGVSGSLPQDRPIDQVDGSALATFIAYGASARRSPAGTPDASG